jgi:hypothetical protein
MENERPLCMSCADMAHLVYLTRGDAALTRRASRYSVLKAVVVRFSRARGRYERQGMLVYDKLLLGGYDRHDARSEIAEEVERMLVRWRRQ